MSYLQTLMFILTVIPDMQAASPSPQRLLAVAVEGALQTIHRNKSNSESGPRHPPAQLCPASCSCHVTAQAITVMNCTKDPSAFLDPLLESQPNITQLKILNSSLARIPEQLCQLSQLKLLQLSYNRLDTLPGECLRKLQHLQQLDVSYNYIRRVQNESFYNMPLEQLNLAHNHISEIEADVFKQPNLLKKLNTIDLNSNHLRSINTWIFLLTDVTFINLSDNQISRVTNYDGWTIKCSFTKVTPVIDLSSNRITHVTDLAYELNITLEIQIVCLALMYHIVLRDNPFICDCIDFRLYSMIQRVHDSFRVNHLFCNKPESLYKKKISAIPLERFICHIHVNCSEECVCVDQPATLNMSVACTNSNMKAVPNELPNLPKRNYRYYLNFMNSKITTLEYKAYLKRTMYAVYTGNKITDLSLGALNALRNAKLVALDNNKLKYLPTNISSINMTTVKDIRLGNNDWACDCHAKETRRWLIQTQAVISDNDGILCKTPSDKSGFNMLRIPEDDLICGKPPNKVLIATLSSVVGSVAVFILVLVLPFAFVYMKRIWLFRKYQFHPFDTDECEGENKEFDIFVSYANENADYVEGDLIPNLQNRGYKVAYHRINFTAGRSIHTSIEYCVLQSKRTLVVFCNAFPTSDYCMLELNVALEYDGKHGTHRLVTIKYGDVDVSSQDLILQSYFQRYSYVEANSNTFWDNLAYALPMTKLGEESAVDGGDHMDEPLVLLEVEGADVDCRDDDALLAAA